MEKFEQVKRFRDTEALAITNAKEYILFCGNHTDGGYKECIRDAFWPLVHKFKPEDPTKAIEKYKNILLEYIKEMPFFDIMKSGIEKGLESVFGTK